MSFDRYFDFEGGIQVMCHEGVCFNHVKEEFYLNNISTLSCFSAEAVFRLKCKS
jgi:hypothetical protein